MPSRSGAVPTKTASERQATDAGEAVAERRAARGDQALRRVRRRRRPQPRAGTGRILHPARAERLRQDDDAADDRRLRAAERAARSGSRARTSPALPPHKRPTNTVFQSYALFPHLSVEANVAFGLKRKRVDKDEIAERVAAELQRVGLAARGEPPPGPALRRHAAAGRPGPGAGQPAQGAAARRAARRARPEAAQGPAGRAEADPARGRDHLRLRHPRPGGGADDERPDRGDEPRPGRAGRRPRGDLRPRRRPPSSPASSASPT